MIGRWLRRKFWNWDVLTIWPSRPISLAQVDQIMREVFIPALRADLSRPNDLLLLIERRP